MNCYAKQQGQLAEQAACDYLVQQGLALITKNYNCKAGEIDLIMQDKNILVFVEVRYRKKTKYGSGIESITKSKQQKIVRAAKYYLLENKLFDRIACRFDVVASAKDDEMTLLWLQDAFWGGWGRF
jgi:putative endonuclease